MYYYKREKKLSTRASLTVFKRGNLTRARYEGSPLSYSRTYELRRISSCWGIAIYRNEKRRRTRKRKLKGKKSTSNKRTIYGAFVIRVVILLCETMLCFVRACAIT